MASKTRKSRLLPLGLHVLQAFKRPGAGEFWSFPHLKPQRVSSIFEAIKTEKSETATTFPPSYSHILHKNVRCIHHEPRTKNLAMMHVDREGSHGLQCVLRFLEHNQPELNTYDVQILISVYSTFLNLRRVRIALDIFVKVLLVSESQRIAWINYLLGKSPI